jgi:hypothetical protein
MVSFVKSILKKKYDYSGFTQKGIYYLFYHIVHFRLIALVRFYREYNTYRQNLPVTTKLMKFACLDDRTSTTQIDQYYFYQDVWGAKICLEIKPKLIVDIGSTALLVGIFSQITKTISIDIRPLPVSISNLICKYGSITQIPFQDNSIEYLNSLCVIEHIGLGRYGDPIDNSGIEKAINELRRVIAVNGYLILSVPVGKPAIIFNAHRIFSRSELIRAFPEFEVVEETFCVPEYTSN